MTTVNLLDLFPSHNSSIKLYLLLKKNCIIFAKLYIYGNYMSSSSVQILKELKLYMYYKQID